MTTLTSRPQPHPIPSLESPARASLVDAARAFGVTLGPSVILDVLVGASIAAIARGRFREPPRTPARRGLRALTALGAAAPLAYALAIRPRLLRWGATGEEVRKPLPGDELVFDPASVATRAVTVNAPVEAVWPWLAQIGQDRGGFYSYEWLENLAGCRLRNAERIHPEWQDRAVGETVLLHPARGLKLARFEPNRILALEGWGSFVLEPVDEQTTRLIARSPTPRGWAALAGLLFWEVPHFVMERKMLLGIKERAERAVGGARA
jgi:hypothetical protein